MDAEDIPFFAALIFPGFFAIQTFVWRTGGIRFSDALRVTWSFVLSVPIFFGTHAFFSRMFQPWEACLPEATANTNCLPSPQVIAANAGEAPVWFLVSLYMGGALLGYLAGWIWRTQQLDRVLLLVGLDVRRHRPALNQALGQEAYIDVQLIDGPLYRGYPRLFSNEDEAVKVIYLTDALRRDANSWKKLSQPLIIPFDRVERVQMLKAQKPLFPEANTRGLRERVRSVIQRAFAAVRN